MAKYSRIALAAAGCLQAAKRVSKRRSAMLTRRSGAGDEFGLVIQENVKNLPLTVSTFTFANFCRRSRPSPIHSPFISEPSGQT